MRRDPVETDAAEGEASAPVRVRIARAHRLQTQRQAARGRGSDARRRTVVRRRAVENAACRSAGRRPCFGSHGPSPTWRRPSASRRSTSPKRSGFSAPRWMRRARTAAPRRVVLGQDWRSAIWRQTEALREFSSATDGAKGVRAEPVGSTGETEGCEQRPLRGREIAPNQAPQRGEQGKTVQEWFDPQPTGIKPRPPL